ncbi:hypothetical protein MIND_00326900 [Mycena indigotica]|uniref:Uncharacterized protein n=1 Tax=Mycena indigotica TaxID=2126181 RepID=A0A8H6T084_9AGAR|nr:uncharacterized protein MIND_00326900 [Mycena indigotica]KAF7309560.1 hypothetical protein MIND_00326900 [Mycena indigotica]
MPPKNNNNDAAWSTGKTSQHRFRLLVNPVNADRDATPPPETLSSINSGIPYVPNPFQKSKIREKFNMMRDRYDRVTVKQQAYLRELDLAIEKLNKLQAENDLLLDALGVAAAQDPASFGLLPSEVPQQKFLPSDLEANVWTNPDDATSGNSSVV